MKKGDFLFVFGRTLQRRKSLGWKLIADDTEDDVENNIDELRITREATHHT